jgi:hypothetical protein
MNMPIAQVTVTTKAQVAEILAKLNDTKNFVEAKVIQFNTNQAYGCKAEALKLSLDLAAAVDTFEALQAGLADAQLQNP